MSKLCYGLIKSGQIYRIISARKTEKQETEEFIES